jgi:hypothetical protein
MIEHAWNIIKNKAVDLTYTDNDLQRMTQGVLYCEAGSYNVAEWTPDKLCKISTIVKKSEGSRVHNELGGGQCSDKHRCVCISQIQKDVIFRRGAKRGRKALFLPNAFYTSSS